MTARAIRDEVERLMTVTKAGKAVPVLLTSLNGYKGRFHEEALKKRLLVKPKPRK